MSSSLVYLFLGFLAIAVWFYYYNSHHDFDDRHNCLHAGVNLSSHPIAVVIPTLHESAVLPATVARLFLAANTDEEQGKQHPHLAPIVVVVDAGRCEDTSACLEPLMAVHPTLHLVQYPGRPSRGAQLNFGAAHAATITPQAAILLFLHADTHLPFAWDDAIRTALLLSPRPPILGTFTLSLPPPISPALRVMLWGANWRARWGGLPYGDQGYFLARRTFDRIGGFPPVPIMEDVELLRRVSRNGQVAVLNDAVETSERRWKQKGVLWNTVLNQVLMTAWLCGVSHETIYRWYYCRRQKQVNNA